MSLNVGASRAGALCIEHDRDRAVVRELHRHAGAEAPARDLDALAADSRAERLVQLLGPLIPYLRQSRAKERAISIEEQRRDVHRWAEAAGVALAAEVAEQNVSGSKPWRERALGEAVDACERGEAAGSSSPGRTA